MSIGITDIAKRLYFIDMIQFMDTEYVEIISKKMEKKPINKSKQIGRK